MTFETYFRQVSYAAVFCGLLSLWVSGSFGVIVSGMFLGAMIAAWWVEGSRWQISEKWGTVLIVLALPVFFVGYRMQIISLSGGESAVAGVLARMILALSAVKLLQRKSDRDWIFLYLMAFFEVLLAAGLSISAVYLGTFLLFLLVMVLAVIAFEIRKTARLVDDRIAGAASDQRTLTSETKRVIALRRLPVTAAMILILIAVIGTPLFFALPRVGGAGLGANQAGSTTSTGFSDNVRLGRIGQIQQNDAVVMRVKIDGGPGDRPRYFRGTALDTFDNQAWSKSRPMSREPFVKSDGDIIRFDLASVREALVVQTIFLEPLDTPILFGLAKPVAVQGNFPILLRDVYGTISYSQSAERISYRVISDPTLPSEARLRSDSQNYPETFLNYQQLPSILDPRIAALARQATANSTNVYDKARATEKFLQTSYGYTLDPRAGGAEPLADFLFNVREGHCEYFATAMAIMLRTQGIPTRIVNGFHGGDYNDAADVSVVRQRNAHAWVEVYFPDEKTWVPFDPTPAVGQPGANQVAGAGGTLTKYLEALETFWIQYFVAFDNQEQLSLARTVRSGIVEYQSGLSDLVRQGQERLVMWLAEVRGEKGMAASRDAIATAGIYGMVTVLVLLLLILSARGLSRFSVWRRIYGRFFRRGDIVVVEFYQRMQTILLRKGLARSLHQTPLEFASAIGHPGVMLVTRAYQDVRFGAVSLSREATAGIEKILNEIEEDGSEVITMSDG